MKRLKQKDIRRPVAGVYELEDGREMPVFPLDADGYRVALAFERGEITGDVVLEELRALAQKQTAKEWHGLLGSFQPAELMAVVQLASALIEEAEQQNPNGGSPAAVES